MAYLLKPSTDLTDRIADAVRDAKERQPDLQLSIAKFYEYSARRALQAYLQNPHGFLTEYQRHQYRNNGNHD